MSSNPTIRFHSGDCSPYDLGHGLAAVGPGWWRMVRDVFDRAGRGQFEVHQVRQSHCLLDVIVRHPEGVDRADEIREHYRSRSARICDVCGGPAVPAAELIPRPTRTHCTTCARRWVELIDERSLWIERAGVWLPGRGL